MCIRKLDIVFSLIVLCVLNGCYPTKKIASVAMEPIKIVTLPIPKDTVRSDAFLENILQQYPQYFDSILQNKKNWNVQFIYTQIDRGANGMPLLKNYHFNLNAAKYFYPASTVKLPVVLLALQKLNELKIAGLDKDATMITLQDFSGQTPVYNDPTSPAGKPSIAQYIKKILMVSDNDAFNRLYEFLGQEYINTELQKRGYGDVQILHRLSIFLTGDENRHTNPIKFYGVQNDLLYDQAAKENKNFYVKRNDSIGEGYYKENKLIHEPMDFSNKNRISLEDLHNILMSLVFPSRVSTAQRFNITENDRNFVLKYMSQLPTESSIPQYAEDSVNFWPTYCKFLLLGSEKGGLNKNVRIFNKVGDAYGQLTDVSYIVDFDKKIEFFLSATIYCNGDGILNDDNYEYNSIGLPFMKHLGEVIYDLELKRAKKFPPNLSPFIFDYDKGSNNFIK